MNIDKKIIQFFVTKDLFGSNCLYNSIIDGTIKHHASNLNIKISDADVLEIRNEVLKSFTILGEKSSVVM